MPGRGDTGSDDATAAPGRVLIYVQGLLGIGHFRRATLLAGALAEAGCTVSVVHGGMPVELPLPPGCEVMQLPPLKSVDTAFSRLVDADGAELTERLKQTRRRMLRRHYRRFEPDAVITEAYPFGRRALRFELEPLLEACHEPGRRHPLVLCSVRDVLQQRSGHREAYTVDTLRRWYHGVLVHGDPALVDLDASFGRTGEIADLLHYTGYVSAEPAPVPAGGRKGVVVSAGGGAAGARVLEATLAARPRTFLSSEPWTLLTGAALGDSAYRAIAGRAPRGVEVSRHRDDFPALLAGARVSVSQCGYNTTTEVLQAGIPAVMVPFEGRNETEQLQRARQLAGAGRVQLIRERELDAVRLAGAIDHAATTTPPALGIRLDGATRSARLVVDMLAARRRGGAA